jgi:UDP-N-acetylmuramate dehydrogenase
MMVAEALPHNLPDSLSDKDHPLNRPEFDSFRTRLRQQADLSKSNWFRVGGPAQWLFRPEHSNDLAAFLALLPKDVPVTVLGVGSNLIVRDGGLDGVVIRLGRGFTQITTQGMHVTAGAAALSLNVALVACEKGITKLEFLSGIPGTIGGAVFMNAGAYNAETSQVLMEAEIVERSGRVRRLSHAEIGFSYRHSSMPEGSIVTQAVFMGGSGDRYEISKRIQEISASREASQPIRSRTGGSTFKNPAGHKAWELIDRAGCRGLTIGGAQVSEKHCNFLINTGDATAKDLELLGEEVRRRVKDTSGIELEWEIKRVGKV